MNAVKDQFKCPHCKHDWLYGWSRKELKNYLIKGLTRKGVVFHSVKCVRCTYEYTIEEIVKLLKGI